MKKSVRRLCVLLCLYAAAFLACIGGAGILTLIVPIPNWHMGALAVWIIFCLGGLCIPEEGWDRLLQKRK